MAKKTIKNLSLFCKTSTHRITLTHFFNDNPLIQGGQKRVRKRVHEIKPENSPPDMAAAMVVRGGYVAVAATAAGV